MKEVFRRVAGRVAYITGTASTFLLAFSIIIVWGLSGPLFNFSNTWQLAINTTTTIVTFLMVFLIQNTQNRDGKALQLKLDELIRANQGASDAFLDLEEFTDDEIERLETEFRQLHEQYADKQLPELHELHKKIAAAKAHRQKR